jgi:hypothetical protein
VSDIPAHRAVVGALFAERASAFLYRVGDHRALAALLRDEIDTERRGRYLACRRDAIRAVIEARWSLRPAAHALARLARGLDAQAPA